jgi:hypothetical protein
VQTFTILAQAAARSVVRPSYVPVQRSRNSRGTFDMVNSSFRLHHHQSRPISPWKLIGTHYEQASTDWHRGPQPQRRTRDRGPFPEEFGWARSKGVRWHLMGEIFERGIVAVIDNVLTEIADAEHLFLSTDIDVLDPAYAPGHRNARAGWYDLPRAAKGRAPADGRARSRGDGPRRGLAASTTRASRPCSASSCMRGTKRSGAQQAKRQAQAREPLTVHPSYCS